MFRISDLYALLDEQEILTGGEKIATGEGGGKGATGIGDGGKVEERGGEGEEEGGKR
jgi:hypothetical protein